MIDRMAYVLGFSGTQVGMTPYQGAELYHLLRERQVDYGRDLEFHHGQCIGADEQALRMAKDLGIWTVSHPPLRQDKMSLEASDLTLLAEDYLDRNRSIVVASHEMVFCPKEMAEVLRSGTWATYRYAKRLNRPYSVIHPTPVSGS